MIPHGSVPELIPSGNRISEKIMLQIAGLRGAFHVVHHRSVEPGAGTRALHRDRARHRTRRGFLGAAARSRRREGRRPGGGRCHAPRTQQVADRWHRGDRGGRARRGADAVHRREGRHQERPQGRYRGRSAGRHHAVRQEHARRDRHHSDGRRRHAAARARRLHGEDRASARAIPRAWSISTRRPRRTSSILPRPRASSREGSPRSCSTGRAMPKSLRRCARPAPRCS